MENLCPESNNEGKRVKTATVESLARAGLCSDVEGHDWLFCDFPTCDVVYFSPGGSVLHRADVTVRVGIKEEDSPHLVCYCFDHSTESILDELKRTGESTVVSAVTEKVRAGECRCETLNPKGTCCLGDLHAAVKEVLGAEIPDEAPGSHSGRCEG